MVTAFRDEDKISTSARVIAEIDKWMGRFDCLVVGPGLGRDPFLLVRLLKRVFLSLPLYLHTVSTYTK